MKSQILYASVIFTISALLISTAMFTADAREVDKSASYTTKGNGVDVLIRDGEGIFQLTIQPNDDSKDYTLTYGFKIGEGAFEKATCYNVSDKIVKISALKKATIEFNTGDLNLDSCDNNSEPSSTILSAIDISVDFFISEPVIDEESEFDNRPQCDEEGNCEHKVGTTKTAKGEVDVKLGDKSLTGTGKIFQHNVKVTYYKK